jgi:hypothetical protein
MATKPPHIDADQRHDRALALLRKHGHKVGKCTDGNHVDVDGKTFKVLEVYKLASERYPAEWQAVERKFTEALRRKKT